VRIRRGENMGAADYIELFHARARFMTAAADRLRDADAWLMPTVAVVPPRVRDLEQDDAFFATNGLVLRNASVINFLDGCAVSLPCGEPGVGLAVCGLRDNDERVLQISAAVEAALS
jgi:aspartyl-tRNA(Asn)/glutamyl-tRNA(Gln) amidotransferase subunit A